jgi:hypothetical protein
VPSSELNDTDHLPGDGKVINTVNTAPTLVTSALLANTNPVDRGYDVLGTVVLLLGKLSKSGICIQAMSGIAGHRQNK